MSDKKILDCRGLPCPQPVIATKKALEAGETDFVVWVDNAAARENVGKFAASQGCAITVDADGTVFRLAVTVKGAAAPDAGIPLPVLAARPLRYLLTQDTMGQGSPELGAVLMKSFFVALREKTPLPAALLLMNSGVRLSCAASPVLESLQELERQGVEVLSCGTCLDYYGLKEKLAVGSVTNMYTIVDLMADGPLITL